MEATSSPFQVKLIAAVIWCQAPSVHGVELITGYEKHPSLAAFLSITKSIKKCFIFWFAPSSFIK